jgi:beta-lactamase regulating signal transducer with metallopeptidase domain
MHVLQIAYWFHPLVWLARARLERWREVCCDREVARVLSGATAGYRRTLLELARPLLARPGVGLGFVSPQSLILARLAWLERPLARRPLAERAATLGAVVLMLVCCLPMATHRAPPSRDLPVLSEQRGCMQLRLAVLAHLARERTEP